MNENVAQAHTEDEFHAIDCIQSILDKYDVANVSFEADKLKVAFNDEEVMLVDFKEGADIEIALKCAAEARNQ